MYQSLFDLQARLDKISDNGDPLEAINEVVPWEMFRAELEHIRNKSHEPKSAAGRKPYDRVLLFKMLILQSLYNLSDDQLEQQTLDRLSFHRFLGLNMGDRVPDSKTIRLFRESLNNDDRARRLFDKFERYLTLKGLKARKGQIIDATVIRVPSQRNKPEENQAIKDGRADEVRERWSEAKSSQKDTDARWGQKGGQSFFGYKRHSGVDVKNKLIRKYTVTSAEVHDSRQSSELLDENNTSRDVYGDGAYPSQEFAAELERRGFRDRLNRKARRNQPLSEKQKQGDRSKSRIRCRVEHVFGAMKQRCGSVMVRTIGLARAATKIGLYCLTYNMSRAGYLCSKSGTAA
jgi:IS5 family transposase